MKFIGLDELNSEGVAGDVALIDKLWALLSNLNVGVLEAHVDKLFIKRHRLPVNRSFE